MTLPHQCQRCAALYNDKPFRSGDQLQPMNCRPCRCHGHALSCHYDTTADDQPGEHYRGGGGTCDDCSHNTTGETRRVTFSDLLSWTCFFSSGRNCELCISEFFRVEGSDPTSPNVCRSCDCDTAGTVNSSVTCAQVPLKHPGRPPRLRFLEAFGFITYVFCPLRPCFSPPGRRSVSV